MKKHILEIARTCASVLAKNYYLYLFAKMVVGIHDNDSNSDMLSNGESKLLHYLIDRNLLHTLFDVGANVGDYSSLALARNSKIKIYAFEPGQANVEQLQDRFQGQENVTIVAQACSDQTGTIEFYQNVDPKRSAADSALDLNTIGYNYNTVKNTIPCTTLDTFCAENGITHIDFLKIDTEGYDLKVLQGTEKMIAEQRIDYIQFEHGHAPRVLRILLLDFVTFFTKYDYTLFVVHPKGLKPLVYTPYEENRYNMINFLAVSTQIIRNLDKYKYYEEE